MERNSQPREVVMIRNIMVPLDGTRFAEAALPASMYLAKRDKALLHLVKVWKPVAPPLLDTAMFSESEPEIRVSPGEGYLFRISALWGGDPKGDRAWEISVTFGD